MTLNKANLSKCVKKLYAVPSKYGVMICICLLIAPFLYVLFMSPFFPISDEGYQLQAALRLAKGYGYNALSVPQADLSTPNHTYLRTWPIGYSFLISLLVKIGLSLELSSMIFKSVLLISGLVLWCRVMNRYVSRIPIKIICLSMLCPLSLLMVVCVTDGILWVLFSILTLLMMTIRDLHDTNGSDNMQKYNIVMAGFLISAALLIKYLSVVVLMIGAIWILYTYRTEYKKAILRALMLISLPVITCSVIFYNNILHTQHVWAFHEFMDWKLKFNFYIMDMLKSILHVFLPSGLIAMVCKRLGVGAYFSLIDQSLAVIVVLVLCCAIFLEYRLRRFDGIMLWFMISFLTLFIFLALLNMFHWEQSVGGFWQRRYFYFLSPFVLLFVADSLILIISQRFVKIFMFLMLVVGAMASYYYSAYRWEASQLSYNNKSEVYKIVQNIRGAKDDMPITIIAEDLKYGLLFQDDVFATYSTDVQKALNQNSFFTRPTLVIVVCEYPLYTCNDGELLLKLSFKSISYSNGTVNWKKFNVGRLFLGTSKNLTERAE